MKTFPKGFYWGEKWDGTHFARLAQLYCEYLEQYSEQVDSVCKTRKAWDPFRKTLPDISGAKRTEISTRCTVTVSDSNIQL